MVSKVRSFTRLVGLLGIATALVGVVGDEESFAIVVARHHEPVGWLEPWADHAVIYNKGSRGAFRGAQGEHSVDTGSIFLALHWRCADFSLNFQRLCIGLGLDLQLPTRSNGLTMNWRSNGIGLTFNWWD